MFQSRFFAPFEDVDLARRDARSVVLDVEAVFGQPDRHGHLRADVIDRVPKEVLQRPQQPAPIALDGGVRSGEDILKALDAGADFVFVGRPFLYAVAAYGLEGPLALFQMLAGELEAAMAMTGRRGLSRT